MKMRMRTSRKRYKAVCHRRSRESGDRGGVGCCQGEQVEDEEEGTEYWTLRDTLRVWGCVIPECIDANELLVVGEVRPEPGEAEPVMRREDSRRERRREGC